MMYQHHPDLTCLAQSCAYLREHLEIESYGYLFQGPPDKIKDSVRAACAQALDARERRGIRHGKLSVQIEPDRPGCGIVVDHVARESELKAVEKTEYPAAVQSQDAEQVVTKSLKIVELAVSQALPMKSVKEVLRKINTVNRREAVVDGKKRDPFTVRLVNIRSERAGDGLRHVWLAVEVMSEPNKKLESADWIDLVEPEATAEEQPSDQGETDDHDPKHPAETPEQQT